MLINAYEKALPKIKKNPKLKTGISRKDAALKITVASGCTNF